MEKDTQDDQQKVNDKFDKFYWYSYLLELRLKINLPEILVNNIDILIVFLN